MNYVYLVWGDLEKYNCVCLDSIYANKEDADKECEELNNYPISENVTYYVEEREVK